MARRKKTFRQRLAARLLAARLLTLWFDVTAWLPCWLNDIVSNWAARRNRNGK